LPRIASAQKSQNQKIFTEASMKPFQWIALSLVSLMSSLWLGSCSAPPSQAIALNFGAAGLVRGPLGEINALYQKEYPQVFLNTLFVGSGPLEAAIEEGEAFDGILFAEIAPLDRLQAKGLILPASRRELLTTDIVVIAPKDSSLQLSDFRELASDRIQSVALGDYHNVGAGRYTHTILTQLGIAQAVEAKAVWAKVDVREILTAVENQQAEVGITVLPEAKTSPKVKVLATASPKLYKPLRSSAAVVKTSAHPQEMQAYLDFLKSDRALEVFQKFGLHPINS
jgi:molybdate transport system substrate-binding protein